MVDKQETVGMFKNPILFKVWGREGANLKSVTETECGRKHPQTKQFSWKSNKTWITNSTSYYLLFIDSPNGLHKLKFAIFEIIGGRRGGGGEGGWN